MAELEEAIIKERGQRVRIIGNKNFSKSNPFQWSSNAKEYDILSRIL
jgi:hypothetical protein